MKKLIVIITCFFTILLTGTLTASVSINTAKQDKIRPSYPFPTFLSTGPYIWYENTKKSPIKGHTYRIATFAKDQRYQIFIEKVLFGDNGCCLEIVEYRELLIDRAFFTIHFPKNTGNHGFKLIRWLSSDDFEFSAYGGNYKLSEIGSNKPILQELELK